MSDQVKRQRVFLCVAKKTKYGWMGKLGGADIAISFGKKNPEDLIISLLERPMEQQQAQPPRQAPPRPQAPPRQAPPSQPNNDFGPWPEEEDMPF